MAKRAKMATVGEIIAVASSVSAICAARNLQRSIQARWKQWRIVVAAAVTSLYLAELAIYTDPRAIFNPQSFFRHAYRSSELLAEHEVWKTHTKQYGVLNDGAGKQWRWQESWLIGP